jgi:Secretion system C-terminal sorting domain
MRYFYLVFLFFIAGNVSSQSSGFTIPTAHPRLWWTTEKLALARQWYAANPFNPRANDPFANAFRYVLTNDATYARKAIDIIVALELPAGQVLPTANGCDNCRYHGENVTVVFDWCYDQMTGAERSLIINRWNKYLEDVNKQNWGGVGMEGNNYYWGNLRNSLEWGIATFHHNAKAQAFLDHALKDRWANSFIPYSTAGEAKGGALGEGPEYGSTMLSYPLIPFSSLSNYGRDIFMETNFFREALVAILYSTTPSPIIKGGQNFYGFFPYNETAVNDLLHERTYYGDVMTTFANHWRDNNLGHYARHWLSLCKPTVSDFVKSTDKAGTAKTFESLPLDYYASGLGILYGRTDWSTNATAFQAQMKDAVNVGHAHLDWGSFQLFRKGRWITRESAGYAKELTGVNNDVVQSEYPDAHNTIFVGIPNDMRSLVGYWQTAPPAITRLETKAHYTYAAVDLSDCFQSEDKPEYFENPYVDKVVREYIFIRPLEAILIFDRIQSKNQAVPAGNVIKTALFHFENEPIIENENNVRVTIGDQVGRLTTLVPSSPTYSVMNEGTNGQYRLHVSTSGQAQSYLINVLQARDVTGTNLTTSVNENATSFQLTLSHATKGYVAIHLDKGAISSGGSFGYSASTIPTTLTPFNDDVMRISVTGEGPVWGGVITDIDDDLKKEHKGESIEVYPNPASSTTTLYVRTISSEHAVISVFNSLGQQVSVLYDGVLVSGASRIQWNTENLSDGIYLIRMETKGGSKKIKRVFLENRK